MKISLVTTRNEKSLAKMRVQAIQPEFKLDRVIRDGAVCLKASVVNMAGRAELIATCVQLGMVVTGQDQFSIIITSDEALNTVRNTLKPLFKKD